MPESVEVRGDVIHITSVGRLTPEDLEKSRQTVMQLVKESGIHKLLVDALEASMELQDLDAFFHIYTIIRDGQLRDLKHAVVVSVENQDTFFLMETASGNRDVRFKIFRSTAEALDWLNEGSTSAGACGSNPPTST